MHLNVRLKPATYVLSRPTILFSSRGVGSKSECFSDLLLQIVWLIPEEPKERVSWTQSEARL